MAVSRRAGSPASDQHQTDVLVPTACPVCAYAKAHASWPPSHRGTHCRRCHRSWVSRAQAHCVVCCEQFATDGVAALHWTADGHVHPSLFPKLERRDEALGPVWRTGQRPLATPWSRDQSPRQSLG
jgi:hypothetical protein